MLRFFRSKLFISLVLICLAFFLSFVILPKMYGSQDETVDIVMVVSDVNLGTKITDNMLRTRTVGKYGLDGGVIVDKNAIIGKYAAQEIDARLPLLPDMFTDTFEEVEGAADTLIQPGQKLFSVSTSSLAKSVAAQIKPGSKVDIYTKVIHEVEYDEWGNPIDDDTIEFELLPELTDLYVYKVHNSSGEDISVLTRKWQANVESGDDTDLDSSLIPATVTLIVNDDQALVLARQEYDGIIHLAMHQETKATETTETDTGAVTDTAELTVEDTEPMDELDTDAELIDVTDGEIEESVGEDLLPAA